MLTEIEITKNLKIAGKIETGVPMKDHTTFKVGGPADVFVTPALWQDITTGQAFCKKSNVPLFILGGGANILVSDLGIRGIVLDMRPFQKCSVENNLLHAEAGAAVSEIVELAWQNGLSGLEFIYGMPGSVGGAIWMNAQCYGRAISEMLESVEYLDENGKQKTYKTRKEDFRYKHSPFQNKQWVICSATFQLVPKNKSEIEAEMNKNKSDREMKGHYRYPSAGSAFKNNRAFGKPTGQIIDETGLKGFSIGGAKVADYHGNIIINSGNATAHDILAVVEHVEREVFKRFGFKLEREILLAGEW